MEVLEVEALMCPACWKPMSVFSWCDGSGNGRAIALCQGCGIDIAVRSHEPVDAERDACEKLERLFEDECVLRMREVH